MTSDRALKYTQVLDEYNLLSVNAVRASLDMRGHGMITIIFREIDWNNPLDKDQANDIRVIIDSIVKPENLTMYVADGGLVIL